jgi:hypothetical protein
MKTAFAIQLRRKEMDDLEESLRTEIKSKRRKATAKDGLYYRPTVLTKSRVVKNEDQWETLFHWLDGMPGVPACAWRLAFATWRDGFSIKSMYHRCCSIGASLMLIKAFPHHEREGSWSWGLETFGVFNSHPLRVTKEFYGSGSCFVFKLHPQPERYNWKHLGEEQVATEPDDFSDESSEEEEVPPPGTPLTGPSFPGYKNRMFINGFHHRLMFGGGAGGPALDLAGDLQSGTTCQSETYGNPFLCSAQQFEIQYLEVYCFDG